ncbi:MAG: ATP-binding protein [Planctomycetota bacterium]|nr:ATP-binding protein [Planctomycetota bacterium]
MNYRFNRLTHKLVLLVLAAAAVEGCLTAFLAFAAPGGSGGDRAFFLVGDLAGVVLTIVLGTWFVHRITRPLGRLSDAARLMGQGRLDSEISGPEGGDEVGQLAAAFRDMQTRLRQLHEQLERRVEERTAELQEATDFVHSILDSSTEYAIIATDLEWRVLTFNEGARRAFGYEPEEILGGQAERLVPPEEVGRAFGDEMQHTLRLHGRCQGEGVRLRKNGQQFPVRAVTTVRCDASGKPLGYTIICRDITQDKALQERLREYTDNLERMVAEKTAELREVNTELVRANQLKSQFLANMSHELRTPLNAIMGFAEAIRDGVAGEPTAEQREFAGDIHQAGRQLLGMINDILDLAKVEAGAMELTLVPCDLAVLIDEVVRVARGIARRKGIDLRTDVEPRPLEVTADALKIKQVLYNLLSNAVKFTGTGGRVSVEARPKKETVEVRVSDTGIGIAPEDLVTIFEEFRQVDSALTRQHEGTGLGLALTRRLVELHGGEITVESQPGKGSTFTVTLLRDLVSSP